MKIFVKVKPSAKEEKIRQISDFKNFSAKGGPASGWEISVKEPPIKGRANEAIVKALARHFGVPPSSVNIVAGRFSRQKIVEITAIDSKNQ